MNRLIAVLIPCLFVCLKVNATTYEIDNAEESVIGDIRIVISSYEDTLLDIARANGFGYQDIKLMNPELDTWLPGDGKEITLPSSFVLPQAPKKGIVLNIPEMRLYYYSQASADGSVEVLTYPLGIGREGWDTPYVKTRITQKKKAPSWRPPKSIRKEHAEKGDPLPLVVKPGPDNPLGNYAMRLGLPSYLIHGTNKPSGIGMRVSHGCIRLYPEDIEEFFSIISVGTPVRIVNQPYKIGAKDGKIFLEAHPYLEEDTDEFEGNLTNVVSMIVNITEERQYKIDWELAKKVIDERIGIPVEIGAFTRRDEATRVELVESDITEERPTVLDLKLETNLPGLLNL